MDSSTAWGGEQQMQQNHQRKRCLRRACLPHTGHSRNQTLRKKDRYLQLSLLIASPNGSAFRRVREVDRKNIREVGDGLLAYVYNHDAPECSRSDDNFDAVQHIAVFLQQICSGLLLSDQRGALVYVVIRSYTTIGKLDSYLFVSDYAEEWEVDRKNIREGIPPANLQRLAPQ